MEGAARRCINYERTIKSESDKQLILDKINSRRNKVAAGEIRSLRPAENMMKLEWSKDLAVSAQTWADQCVEHSVPDVEDTCRNLDNTSVGQNIATIYGDSPGLTPMTLVDLWYIELLELNISIISRYQRSSVTGAEHYDYFTQLMWAETSQVGCGGVKFREKEIKEDLSNKSRTVYRLVCNFAPAGNVLGQPVYTYGLPCSRCTSNAICDPVYRALCAQNNTSRKETTQNDSSIKHSDPTTSISYRRPKYFSITDTNISKLKNDARNLTVIDSESELSLDYDENISYDLFSDLLEHTTTTTTYSLENTTICKDILVVDDLFNLLKKKLSTDQTLRDFLLTGKSSQKNDSTEEPFTDPSVAAIMSHIYKIKESMTVTKTTNAEYLNSTLLVDLVEAVIFRNNDKISTSDATESNTQSSFVIKPIKIQAELGEIGSNKDFTGHYFFPEDNYDKSSSDLTEDYYDTSDISVSDVAFEIEDLKRNKGTKDFLEEILESDFVTETVSRTKHNDFGSYVVNKDNEKSIQYIFPKIRNKRLNGNIMFTPSIESSNFIRERRKSLDSFICYNDLLRKLAADLKLLKLNKQFHCSKNNAVKQIFKMHTFLIIMCYSYVKLNIIVNII